MAEREVLKARKALRRAAWARYELTCERLMAEMFSEAGGVEAFERCAERAEAALQRARREAWGRADGG